LDFRMMIRDEQPSDVETLFDITAAAFEGQPYSQQTEPYIVNALRAAGALAISLVAEMGGDVVGHVAFSCVKISDGSEDWYTLGPVSVLPARQKQGIGSALIRQGLADLKKLGARGCMLVGHPGYYERFGFAHVDGLGMDGVPPDVFFALPFEDKMPQGTVTIHKAFFVTG
jgi:putative acetyltransferase